MMDKMERDWWKKAVVYQIYPKSFYDSNGDGEGDIGGIIEKLDYLQWLGVDVLWICPVYCSPMVDNGYDISDYYHIDPSFGSDQDMDRLIQEADRRGMKILMDLVVNHTSDQHIWFQEARKDPKGPYGSYYIFRKGVNGDPPDNLRSYFGGSAWEPVGTDDLYYFHAFAKEQPDLNWENPAVREAICKMVNYWLDKGVGGFRIDAIGNIKKNLTRSQYPVDGEDGLSYAGAWIQNQPGIEALLAELDERTFRLHNSMTVAEVGVPEERLEEFIGENGFFRMVFDFSYTDIDVPDTAEWYVPTGWTVEDFRRNLYHSQLISQNVGWAAPYLENHDQPRSLNKYIPEEDIGYHSASMLAALFLCLRGTPFIYQGQEIGMTNIRMERLEDYDDVATIDQYHRALRDGASQEDAWEAIYRRSRDNSRTPMQWNSRKNAGFSECDETWLKVNPNYQKINVEAEQKDGDSLLHFYRKLIQLRKEGRYHDVLTYGSFSPYEPVGRENMVERSKAEKSEAKEGKAEESEAGKSEAKESKAEERETEESKAEKSKAEDSQVIAYIREFEGRRLLIACNFGRRQQRLRWEKTEKLTCVLDNYGKNELTSHEKEKKKEQSEAERGTIWLRPYECGIWEIR